MLHNLKIAEIVFSISSVKQQLPIDFPAVYNQFLTHEAAEINLIVDQVKLPSISSADPVLLTGGVWNLFTESGRWLIPISGSPGEDPWLLARLAHDYRSGELLINQNTSKKTPYYPMAYPIDELIMVNLLSQGLGVDLHACAVAVSNFEKGLIFAGISGAGKSTLTRLWQERQSFSVLSDDRVILRKKEGGYWIYGTPWHGDALGASSSAVPVNQIFILHQASHNYITPLKPIDAATRLLLRCFPTFWDANGMSFTLELLDELSRTIPCYEFGFLADQSAIDFILQKAAV